MSNEIKITLGLEYNKNGKTIDRHETFYDNVSGDNFYNSIQSIGVSEEAVVATDIGTYGWYFVKNLDTTNYVELGTTGSLNKKIPAGKANIFSSANALYAKANTNTLNVEVIAIEA
jgi:hypothetical protein